MQALCLSDKLSFNQQTNQPKLEINEALIRLSLAGICATDLELVKGYAGFSGILGHEFIGVVDAVENSNDRHWLKQRVVGSINIGCNNCPICKQQGPAHCANRKVLGIRGKDGAFADYLTLPVKNLCKVPNSVSDQAAVFTEPLAAAIRVRDQVAALNISTIAVLGPGRLGMLIAKVLALANYDVTVVGRSKKSLKLPTLWQLKTAEIEQIEDNSYHCVVDATGQSAGFKQALRITSAQGYLVLKSTFSAKDNIDLSKVVVAEINIIGSRCGPFASALELLEQKVIPVESMVDGVYNLSEGLAAFDYAQQVGIRKVLLRP